jgi:cell division protease FtsH
MSRHVPNASLPERLTLTQAVEAAYPTELLRCEQALARGLPVLVRCDKELTPAFYRVLRARLRARGLRCDYLDGRPRPGDEDTVRAGTSMVAAILRQLREAVRGPAGGRVVVMPHLDVLSSSMGGAAHEAREIIPLLYENTDIVWLGFEDPNFAIPTTIERLFPHREVIYGVRRERLAHLVCRQEARVLGGDLDSHALYACVSGMSVVRLRRVLSSVAERQDADPAQVYAALRQFTLGAEVVIPRVDLEHDIGGYPRVKERIERELIDIVRRKDELDDDDAIAQLERILPRGFVIWGPSGTGKTLFAEAVANAVGAAVLQANGPELKTRWLVESTDAVRQLFVQARRSAPSMLIIDELDAIARPAGASDSTSQAMVKQLLTQMDALRPSELVFVVGTTSHIGALEPTLLRPGRFEFHVHVPYPDADNRRAILRIHDEKLGLRMGADALEHAVRSTSGIVEGGNGERYSGDHLQALCRQLARERVRNDTGQAETTVEDVDAALEAYLERPALSPEEQYVIATHEAGHAVCALACEHAPPIDRISIRGDLGALGYVRYASSARRYITKQNEVLDIICTLFGGREAERLLLDDISAGAGNDIMRATELARVLVEDLAMGSEPLRSRVFTSRNEHPPLAPETLVAIDRNVHAIVDEQRKRCRDLLAQHRTTLETLRDALLERQVLESDAIAELLQVATRARPAKKRRAKKKKAKSKSKAKARRKK